MRGQLSAHDIVVAASQLLGFWPPGYSDSPCAGLKKAVEMLGSPGSAREERLLGDVIEQRQRYCR